MLFATKTNRAESMKSALQLAGWKVRDYKDPQKAIAVLRGEHDFEMIMCDAQLTGASASGLLTFLKRLEVDVPFFVVDPYLDPRLEKLEDSIAGKLSYPLKENEVPIKKANTVATVNPDKTLTNLNMSGNTSDVAISDMLELMGFSKRTSRIKFGDEGDQGSIYVENGLIVEAHVNMHDRKESGLSALAILLHTSDLIFNVVEYKNPPSRSIQMPVATAMTEAARLADEDSRFDEMVEALLKLCPLITDVAFGYVHSPTPSHGFGSRRAFFREVKDLYATLRSAQMVAKTVTISTARYAIVAEMLEDDNLFAAKVPSNARHRLYQAMFQVLKEKQDASKA